MWKLSMPGVNLRGPINYVLGTLTQVWAHHTPVEHAVAKLATTFQEAVSSREANGRVNM